jgi:hypothetical protein
MQAQEVVGQNGFHLDRINQTDYDICQNFDIQGKHQMFCVTNHTGKYIAGNLHWIDRMLRNIPQKSNVTMVAVRFEESFLPLHSLAKKSYDQIFLDGNILRGDYYITCNPKKRTVHFSMKLSKRYNEEESTAFWGMFNELYRTLVLTQQLVKYEAAIKAGNAGRISRMKNRMFETVGDLFPLE